MKVKCMGGCGRETILSDGVVKGYNAFFSKTPKYICKECDDKKKAAEK